MTAVQTAVLGDSGQEVNRITHQVASYNCAKCYLCQTHVHSAHTQVAMDHFVPPPIETEAKSKIIPQSTKFRFITYIC